MAHLALYREWRPKTFDEVVEQKQAVYALRQSVISGQIAHAYLFSGTRGTGKTTLAKIFSRAINCLHPDQGNPCNQCDICRAMLDGNLLDVVEMDAASNNSVDNIRRLCDEVVFMPSQARYKVYIIDEVHMLSTGAFNALLKTLEEPPAHAVFILATTEPHRIPATILSRCQRYDFRRIPVDSMTERLTEIARADQIPVTPDALQTIASLADGGLRDAISLLDQAKASFPGTIDRDNVLSLAGIVRDDFLQQVALSLVQGQVPQLLAQIEQLVMTGRDLARFVTDLAQHFRNILVCQVSEDPRLLVRANSETLADMRRLASKVSNNRLIEWIRGLSALLSDLRWAADGRTVLEVGLIRLAGLSEPQTAAVSAQALPVNPAPQVAQAAPAKAAMPESKPAAAPEAPVSVSPPPAPQAVLPADRTAAPDLPAEDDSAAVDPSGIPWPDDAPPAEETAWEPEAGLAQKQQTAAVPAAESVKAAANPSDAAGIWQSILTGLLDAGQMTLYLFSRPARPRLQKDSLQLFFDSAEIINYQEVNQAANLKLLRSLAAQVFGANLNIQLVLAGQETADALPETPKEDEWIQKMKTTAQNLGIPVKVEE
ncbi:MAG: DNA polymerase III subunit gamma/tau [Clostridiaceae bacterium]|nr:DNA polymerase III subunit gamma/tau [Clostridiaceae bacterium]